MYADMDTIQYCCYQNSQAVHFIRMSLHVITIVFTWIVSCIWEVLTMIQSHVFLASLHNGKKHSCGVVVQSHLSENTCGLHTHARMVWEPAPPEKSNKKYWALLPSFYILGMKWQLCMMLPIYLFGNTMFDISCRIFATSSTVPSITLSLSIPDILSLTFLGTKPWLCTVFSISLHAHLSVGKSVQESL